MVAAYRTGLVFSSKLSPSSEDPVSDPKTMTGGV
jgi:hypothetical protein